MNKLLIIATILTAANAFAGKEGSDKVEPTTLTSDAGAGNRDGGSAGSSKNSGNEKLFGNEK